jgi:Spy/CpxP family protein refolding chaperone
MEAAESENVTEDEIKDLSEKVVDLMTVMALNKAQMKKDIKALLTDEQVEKFNEIHSKNKECMGKKGKSCSKGDKNCGKKRKQNRKKNKDKECEECSK